MGRLRYGPAMASAEVGVQPQAAGSAGERVSSGAETCRKMAAPGLKAVSASAASTTAAAVQLLRSAGKGAEFSYCQPVQ